jgi:hypothetical protein
MMHRGGKKLEAHQSFNHLKEKKKKKKKKGKVHLTPSNYYPNDNLPHKLSITIIYLTKTQTTKTMTM